MPKPSSLSAFIRVISCGALILIFIQAAAGAQTSDFQGIWVEQNPEQGPPMRLRIVQNDSTLKVSMSYRQEFGPDDFTATLDKGEAMWKGREGCAERFRYGGFSYDNPGFDIFRLRLQGAVLEYEQEIHWLVPCDGHPPGVGKITKELWRTSGTLGSPQALDHSQPTPQAPDAQSTGSPAPAPAGPRSLSEAEAALQHGALTVWVPKSYLRGMASLPISERSHEYQWEGLRREFKDDFPNFDLRLVEMDRDEFIRQMHSSPSDAHFPDVAFADNNGEVRPLLNNNAAIQMWGQSRLNTGFGGWWMVFRQSKNFAASEAFLLWASQRFHWTPWNVSTNTISAPDVAAVQELSRQAVQDFAKPDTPALGSIMDPEAAHFLIPRSYGGGQTLLSIQPLLTFGNSRLAFALLAAVGESSQTFGMAHFGLIARKTESGWKVWYFLPNRPLPELVQFFQPFDHLGIEETAAQDLPKVTLIAPADHAKVPSYPPSEIAWSTVDAPLATYVVESQFGDPDRENLGPSRLELVAPISVEPSIHKEAPRGTGRDPLRWRVWAISKAGIMSASDWRVIDASYQPAPVWRGNTPVEGAALTPAVSCGGAPGATPCVASDVSSAPSSPKVGATANPVQHPAGDAVAAIDPPCIEWIMAAERGQPMIAPHIAIRYNPLAPGARLASSQSLTLIVASHKGVSYDRFRIPMAHAADGTWRAEFTPERNYIAGYAIFYFEDEKNRMDNHGGQYWDILNCDRGEPDPTSVCERASTYQGQLLAPGIQRPADLARALDILRDDIQHYPDHYVRDDFYLWRFELMLAGRTPAAYELVARELDAYMTEHSHSPFAMMQLGSFIASEQQNLPSGVIERFRQAVAALPYPSESEQINAQLDYGLLRSEQDKVKRVQGYLAFAARYPRSTYTRQAYQSAFYAEVALKDVAGAESVLEKLEAIDHDRPEPLLTMAEFYIDQKTQLDRAVKLLDTARAILTDNQAHYAKDLFIRETSRIDLLHGQACVLLNDLPRARTDLESAAQARPDDPKVLYALGEVREKMGDMAPALDAYLAAASASYQENSDAHDAYERLFVAQKRGTQQEAEQQILDRSTQNARHVAADYIPIAMNRKAPEFAFTDLAGKQFNNQAAKGKPAILTFWSVWCGVCVAELPALQEFQKQHPEANVLAVELGHTPEEVKSLLSAHKLNTLRVAVSKDTPPEFGISWYPNMQVMDRFGQIQFVHSGGVANVEAILGKDLQALPAPE